MAYVRKVKAKNYWVLCEQVYDYDKCTWKQQHIKSLGKITAKQANQILNEYETKLKLQQFDIHQSTKKLFSEAIEDYIYNSRVEQLSPDYIRVAQTRLKRFCEFLSNPPVENINASHFESFRKHLLGKTNLSPNTINHMLRNSKAFFSFLVRTNQLAYHPLKNIKMIRLPEYEPEIPTEEDIQKMLSLANLHLKHIIIFLIYTGLRKNELLKLQFKNVDFERNQLVITPDKDSGFRTKSRKPRRIPIHPNLESSIKFLINNWIDPVSNKASQRLDHQRAYLFCHKDGRPFDNIWKSWVTLRNKAGLPNLRIHHCRHFACSFLYKYTRDIYFVMQVLGHSTVKVTERYCHLLGDHEQRQIAKVPNIGGDN
jgi:integrase